MTQNAGTVQLQVTWGTCSSNHSWCPLNTVDLGNSVFDGGGVYLIWYGNTAKRALRVGQAKVLRDRLTAWRSDPAVQAYERYGLYVTWAPVASLKRDGVEVYLAKHYKPLLGERWPDAIPIAVNLPW